MDILELKRRRANLVSEARKLVDRAEQEKRELSGEEQAQYERYMTDIKKLGEQAEREERLQAVERELGASAGTVAGGKDTTGGTEGNTGAEESRAAFRKFLRSGFSVLREPEMRALQAGQNDLGGYIVAPEQFVRDLIMGVDNMVFIRQLATKFTVATADSLGAPALDTDASDADWTAEIQSGSEDTAMKFGKRELHPHPLAKRVKVSNKLLRQAILDPEALVRQRLAYKFAVTEEKAFLTGSGANQPLGIFTASNLGISTSRDISTDNTTTAITGNGLIKAKYALKGQYWAKAQWLFHRDALAQIATLKDTAGQYLWRESLRAGEPDRLCGFPVLMSEYAPNTFTAGQYVGALADFSHYWIADALDMQIQRLVELYAEANQTGFIGRRELDGMPTLEEAFVRVKLAAS